MLNDPSTPPFIQAGQGGNEKVLQAMNITNKNCIKEFYMFIHGPFATNIYLDIMAEVGAKVLTNDEVKILDFIKGRTKADKEIAKHIGRDVSDLYGLVAGLVIEGFAKEETRNGKTIFFSRKYFSITRKGIRKLNTLLVDASLKELGLKKLKAEKHFRKIIRYPFDQGEHTVLAKVPLENFMKFPPRNIENGKVEFTSSTFTIYTVGIGIFSAQIKVTLYNETPITSRRREIEEIITNEIDKIFLSVVSPFIERFSKTQGGPAKKIFKIDSSKVARKAWLHIAYWFYGDQNLIDKIRDDSSKEHRDFTYLLGMEPAESTYLPDQYAFYGWGRSLIITSNKDPGLDEEWVHHKISFIETIQYIYSGLRLLDYILSKKRKESKMDLEDSITEVHRRELKQQIKELKEIRHLDNDYVEHFENGLSMLKLQEFSLYDSIQKHWSLDQVQTHIKNNLELIEKVLSAKEHLLIANKQDQLNKIAQIFTTVAIAGVIAAVLELHPLKEVFDPEKHRSLPLSMAFLSTEVAIAFIATISFIMLIMFLVLRSHGFAKKIRDRFAPSYQEE